MASMTDTKPLRAFNEIIALLYELGRGRCNFCLTEPTRRVRRLASVFSVGVSVLSVIPDLSPKPIPKPHHPSGFPHLSLALSVNGEGTGEVREGLGVRVEKPPLSVSGRGRGRGPQKPKASEGSLPRRLADSVLISSPTPVGEGSYFTTILRISLLMTWPSQPRTVTTYR